MSPPPPPRTGDFGVLVRFLAGLTLLRRLLPGVLLLIVLASSTPQVFLWYIGAYLRCGAGAGCTTTWLGQALPLRIWGLALIALAGMLLRIAAWAAFELAGMWSTSPLHDRMIAALARTRTTYFDETPSGHLINRITGDFGNLRFMGIIRVGDATNASVEVLATMVLVFLVNPWPALAILPVTAAFLAVQLAIGPMLGHAEELASAALGEVVHRETDLIEGQRIYALYGRLPELLRTLSAAFDRLTHAKILSARLTAWSRTWTRVLAAGYGFVVFVFVTLGIEAGRISLPLAAVIVSALFSLSGSFSWFTWCLAFLTETLGNARRVYELVDLPPEEAEEHAPPRPPAAARRPAPAAAFAALGGGAVDLVFRELCVAYRPGGAPVLAGLSLTIPAGAKVGIIGRTGAGKSSVVQALFRMVHVLSGDVTLGGRSIYDLELPALRARFGVVPQTPYLFAGTVRDNLDRYKTASEDDVRRALDAVELPLAPSAPLTEGGRNLSVGERQLLCLARVLLAQKPVIIMDEPTSSVDAATDAKIQRLVADGLRGRTIITIAHRTRSLARYDKVVELEAGRVVREGAPAVFLAAGDLD